MSYADDATKTWISARPKKNADGNVIEWKCEYNYTLNSFSHTFSKIVQIEIPSKAPASYTKAEILVLMDKDHWDDMFTKKYAESIRVVPVETIDNSFDVGTLSE